MMENSTESNWGLVSVITPAWKAEQWIGETIESVLAQTYTNWEMWVVDDLSPDHTAGIVLHYAARDSRVRLIRQPVNGGPAAARNAAILAAKGRWLAFLDSDDLWLPEKLATQLTFQVERGAVLTYTEFRRMSATAGVIGRQIAVPSTLTYAQLLGNTAIATSTVIVDRHLAGEVQMKAIYYDDFGCWLDILRGGRSAMGLHQDLMRYRVVSGSVSRNKWRSVRELWIVYRRAEALGLLASVMHFTKYAIRAFLKYRRF
jgi:teichuronic acid biosynthesis glycosyltransferase TuaG